MRSAILTHFFVAMSCLLAANSAYSQQDLGEDARWEQLYSEGPIKVEWASNRRGTRDGARTIWVRSSDTAKKSSIVGLMAVDCAQRRWKTLYEVGYEDDSFSKRRPNSLGGDVSGSWNEVEPGAFFETIVAVACDSAGVGGQSSIGTSGFRLGMPRWASQANPWLLAGIAYLAIALALNLVPSFGRLLRQTAESTVNPADVGKLTRALRITTLLVWPFTLIAWIASKRRPVTAWDLFTRNPLYKEAKKALAGMEAICETEGVDADELPGAWGRFGYDKTNPIPTRTIIGSGAYLRRLRDIEGKPLGHRRVGAVTSMVSRSPIDVYELLGESGGLVAKVYVSPYHKRNSRKAPQGFLLEGTDLIT